MKKDKLKKGGLDTIVAYIVVSLPLLYVLIYMVATIYHFSVQMYINQVVKEATVMISTYGAITDEHEQYIRTKVGKVFDENSENPNASNCEIKFYIRNYEDGMVGSLQPLGSRSEVNKADIVGISVKSTEPSILGRVTGFSMFGNSTNSSDLFYSAYREEIIRNERPLN